MGARLSLYLNTAKGFLVFVRAVLYIFPDGAAVAQLTVNQRVAGSNPARGARIFGPRHLSRPFCRQRSLFGSFDDGSHRPVMQFCRPVMYFFKAKRAIFSKMCITAPTFEAEKYITAFGIYITAFRIYITARSIYITTHKKIHHSPRICRAGFLRFPLWSEKLLVTKRTQFLSSTSVYHSQTTVWRTYGYVNTQV